MSKGLAILLALGLPGAAAGQEIGVQVQVLPRVEQPFLEAATDAGRSALISDVPAGWSLRVERGAAGGSVRAHAVTAPVSSTRRVVPIVGRMRDVRSDYVTVTFAPI